MELLFIFRMVVTIIEQYKHKNLLLNILEVTNDTLTITNSLQQQ